MTYSLFYLSERAKDTVQRIANIEGVKVYLSPVKGLKDLVASKWDESEGIILVGSTGIAVRVIAPLLKDKTKDPSVIVVTEDGKTVIPLTGAHLGGGRELAESISKELDSDLINTTSSDRLGLDAPDILCSRWNWSLKNRSALVKTNGKLIDQKILYVWIRPELETPPLPDYYEIEEERSKADIIISHKVEDLKSHQVQLIPKTISVGLGCRKDKESGSIDKVIIETLENHNIERKALKEIATIDLKASEAGLIETAKSMALPVVVITEEEIKNQEGPFSPSAASKHLGLPGVCEPCAASRGKLIGPRTAKDGVTVALSISPYDIRGSLSVIGTGPGDERFMTLEAKKHIESSHVVIGYRLYVEQLPQRWLKGKIVRSYGMGQEEERVRSACEMAQKGYKVALVSGGDPILFGMAGLAHNIAPDDIDLSIVTGISAVQAAGSFLGAPYSNGLIMISLSDYLQPWQAIEKSLQGAAKTGLTVALYNPVKRDLATKLERVKKAFSDRENQQVWLVSDAGRPLQRVRTVNLAELEAKDIDMRTMLLLPGESTITSGDLLVDTRGYKSERK